VLLKNETAVRALAPDLRGLQALSARYSDGLGNLGVTAPADAGRPYDFVSRFFAPGSGVPEDPTTGSYHCAAARLLSGKLGRSVLRFHQAYPGRGGDLETDVKGDRVKLRGQAVTVVEGRLRL
jgi:predicted PhzF superfamily epimerase YddE/YHI9